MQTQPAEPRTTPAASTSPSPPPPPDRMTPTPVGVTAPPLTVRPPTRSTTTANGAASPASDTAAAATMSSPDPFASSGDTPSASDEPTAALKLKKRPLADVFRGLVLGAAAAVHQALARSEIEQAHGVWLMGEDEAAGVADPLASIAGRRAGGAVVNADMADLVSAGVATAAYVISNSYKQFQIRRAMRSMARSGLNTDPNTEPEQGEAA